MTHEIPAVLSVQAAFVRATKRAGSAMQVFEKDNVRSVYDCEPFGGRVWNNRWSSALDGWLFLFLFCANQLDLLQREYAKNLPQVK